MKKVVPFSKQIPFNRNIAEITDIEVSHNLKLKNNYEIEGNVVVEGKYKMTLASQIDEEFSYKIPVDIDIDKKYDISDIILDIEDFTYEIIDEEKLVLNITVSIDNIKEKDFEEQIEVIDEKISDDVRNNNDTIDEFLEKFEQHSLEIPSNEEQDEPITNEEKDCYDEEMNLDTNMSGVDIVTNNIQDNDGVNSLFSSFKDSVETYKTYSVYIVKEEDTLNSIMQKYNIDKELLEEYNDLSNITTGSKIVVPSSKNE